MTSVLQLPAFERHDLFGQFVFFSGRLPPRLEQMGMAQFEALWTLHPQKSNEILIHGRMVAIPRWQQAYGRDYHFSGTVNQALPVPELLTPFLQWVSDEIDARLNGLLLNWYDPEHGHYIGTHRDHTRDLVPDTPIVTISLGHSRVFRLRPFQGRGFIDFEAGHATVFVMPWETNLGVKHEVPHSAKAKGQRISITARAFKDA